MVERQQLADKVSAKKFFFQLSGQASLMNGVGGCNHLVVREFHVIACEDQFVRDFFRFICPLRPATPGRR